MDHCGFMCIHAATCGYRYASLTDKSVLDTNPDLYIRLVPNKVNNTLEVIDSGCGMTKVSASMPSSSNKQYLYWACTGAGGGPGALSNWKSGLLWTAE